ncbi:MAG: YHS domain-containing (seleno)protein [Acidiferrobacterales bacterium]
MAAVIRQPLQYQVLPQYFVGLHGYLELKMKILTAVKENKIKFLAITFVTSIAILLVFLYSNKIAPVSMNVYGDVNTDNGIALQGIDTVAYHKEGKMIPGDPAFRYEAKNAVWQFSSEENRNLFASAPEKYMPQYGGYCAYAVSQGATASSKPGNWTIYNGKLYVFHTPEVKKTWLDEIGSGSITKADENWGTRSSG